MRLFKIVLLGTDPVREGEAKPPEKPGDSGAAAQRLDTGIVADLPVRHGRPYMIWLTTPPSTRRAAPEVPEAASLQR